MVVCIASHLTLRDLVFSFLTVLFPFPFTYLACCAMNSVTLGEAVVRCRECGYRILYKARQRRRK